ncbi:hypothetical protein [Clostridium formicaceticum]|uniref:Uncharacterized protein n=1 Tax=Clostridium formicaceticum TaxID=1497 RepID=A0AAC9WGJ4_9CLOT|nr:hypothetical protein [Clostridium formicaceticum]AOY77459.1 hypothetical protein BJL90_17325 [Clostridium formicaceticum]ARE88017.1 hypothetical protein CLFO_24180 [Clostridium formicaceticum]
MGEENTFIKVTSIEDAEFTIYSKKYNNPIELLEKLYRIRNEKSLSNEEKNKKVQKIMKEYME